MGYYIKKPIVMETIEWTGKNTGEVMAFCCRRGSITDKDGLVIFNRTGNHKAYFNDMIIKDEYGELTVCNPDIFKRYYISIKEENPVLQYQQ